MVTGGKNEVNTIFALIVATFVLTLLIVFVISPARCEDDFLDESQVAPQEIRPLVEKPSGLNPFSTLDETSVKTFFPESNVTDTYFSFALSRNNTTEDNISDPDLHTALTCNRTNPKKVGQNKATFIDVMDVQPTPYYEPSPEISSNIDFEPPVRICQAPTPEEYYEDLNYDVMHRPYISDAATPTQFSKLIRRNRIESLC